MPMNLAELQHEQALVNNNDEVLAVVPETVVDQEDEDFFDFDDLKPAPGVEVQSWDFDEVDGLKQQEYRRARQDDRVDSYRIAEREPIYDQPVPERPELRKRKYGYYYRSNRQGKPEGNSFLDMYNCACDHNFIQPAWARKVVCPVCGNREFKALGKNPKAISHSFKLFLDPHRISFTTRHILMGVNGHSGKRYMERTYAKLIINFNTKQTYFVTGKQGQKPEVILSSAYNNFYQLETGKAPSEIAVNMWEALAYYNEKFPYWTIPFTPETPCFIRDYLHETGWRAADLFNMMSLSVRYPILTIIAKVSPVLFSLAVAKITEKVEELAMQIRHHQIKRRSFVLKSTNFYDLLEEVFGIRFNKEMVRLVNEGLFPDGLLGSWAQWVDRFDMNQLLDIVRQGDAQFLIDFGSNYRAQGDWRAVLKARYGKRSLAALKHLWEIGHRRSYTMEDFFNLYIRQIDQFPTLDLREIRDLDEIARLHDELSAAYQVKKNEGVAVRFKEVVQDLNYLAYQGEQYQIVVPQTYDELVTEGIEMHHCVASYLDAMVERTTAILFLRDLKNNRVATIEVRKWEIHQIKAKFNHCPEEDVLAFVKEWTKKKCLWWDEVTY